MKDTQLALPWSMSSSSTKKVREPPHRGTGAPQGKAMCVLEEEAEVLP